PFSDIAPRLSVASRFALLYSSGCTRTFIFFFNAAATTEIYTLSLHDALPISPVTMTAYMTGFLCSYFQSLPAVTGQKRNSRGKTDRKSTRLNSSHVKISYAVFCLKKKKKTT